MSLILPNLLLGDINGAHDLDFLQKHGITHVLSALECDFSTPELVAQEVVHMRVLLFDCEDEKISDVFERTTEFIRSALAEGGVVYVHCLMGMSRSPTLVAAYLILEKGMTDGEALEFLHARRSCVDPNAGFRRALAGLSIDKNDYCPGDAIACQHANGLL
jgi:protein-tyrosine phosphatase